MSGGEGGITVLIVPRTLRKCANNGADHCPEVYANFAQTSRELIQYLCLMLVPNTWGACTNFLLFGVCQWGAL